MGLSCPNRVGLPTCRDTVWSAGAPTWIQLGEADVTRKRMMTTAAAAVAVVVAVGAWYVLIRDNAPPPLALDDVVATATTAVPNPTPTPAPGSESTPTPGLPSPTDAPGSLASVASNGPWAIDPTGTIVGYRIEEEIAGFGGNTAVGRTSEVTGGLVFDGASIDAVEVTVDMTTLVSSDSRRDSQMRSRGLQTTRFPQATFVLDSPIELGAPPVVGEVISAQAVGILTLHGVSRDVTFSIEAQLVDEMTIVVVGGVEVALADYDIDPPVGFGILSVADVGTFEFQLSFIG